MVISWMVYSYALVVGVILYDAMQSMSYKKYSKQKNVLIFDFNLVPVPRVTFLPEISQIKEKCENFGDKPNRHWKLKRVDKMTADKTGVDVTVVDKTRVDKLECYCSFPPLTVTSVPWYTGHHPFILFFLKRSTSFTSFFPFLAGFVGVPRQQQKGLLAGSSSCSGSDEWGEVLLASSGSSSVSRKEPLLAGSCIALRLRSSVPVVQERRED